MGKNEAGPGLKTPGTRSGESSSAQRFQGDGYDLANRMGLEQEGRLYPFFDALWRRVDAVTTYPKDFVDQRIEGRVTVQLVVDQRGVFTGDIRSIRGGEPMLNTLVVATLVHALSDPLPPKQWMSADARKQMLLVFQFEFHLIGEGQLPRSVEYRHLKNILSFRRDAWSEPVINRKIEKFLTHYMPPIIPIPGGFIIDFPRAYYFVKNLIHPEPDEDELREQRLKMTKEQLERFIQKSGASVSP